MFHHETHNRPALLLSSKCGTHKTANARLWPWLSRNKSLKPFTLFPHRWEADRSRDWYFVAEQPVSSPHLAHLEGFSALRIVLVTLPLVSQLPQVHFWVFQGTCRFHGIFQSTYEGIFPGTFQRCKCVNSALACPKCR